MIAHLILLPLAAAAMPAAAGPAKDDRPLPTDVVHYDEVVDETGRLAGGRTRIAITAPSGRPIPATVHTFAFAPGGADGPSDNRIDLVVVGDGYTAGELPQYAADADAIVAELFAQQPLLRYRSFFVVHRIDVVSNESGVDNDPMQGVRRDTALDMEFWCDGIERLLCVNVGAAYDYAANAPDVDHVLAIANSEKYGGAGYTTADLATASARHFWSPEVAIHEYGHSFANLADEYWTDGTVYSGPEPPDPNASRYDEIEMAQRNAKWARWLGVNRPNFDGLVSTYEGASYYEFGLYRPSENSKMRSLDRPFNAPSVESWVIEFYRLVHPIDDATPSNTILRGDERVFVDPVDLEGASLDVQWFLDGGPIPGATGETLDLAALQLEPGMYELSVRVVDNTGWVRNEQARNQWMSESRQWLIETLRAGDLNCDGATDAFDIGPFIIALLDPNLYAVAFPNCDVRNADVNEDGAVDAFDIGPFVALLSP